AIEVELGGFRRQAQQLGGGAVLVPPILQQQMRQVEVPDIHQLHAQLFQIPRLPFPPLPAMVLDGFGSLHERGAQVGIGRRDPIGINTGINPGLEGEHGAGLVESEHEMSCWHERWGRLGWQRQWGEWRRGVRAALRLPSELSRRQHGAARRAGDYARIAPCRLACSPCAWNQAERAAFCRRRCPLRPGCSLPPGLEERNLLSCPAFGGRRRAARSAGFPWSRPFPSNSCARPTTTASRPSRASVWTCRKAISLPCWAPTAPASPPPSASSPRS